MANKSKTKCLSCGEIFTADVRNRGRQKYCSKPACRAAGKAARQRRWREQPQNQDYFRGPVHVERVRVWRAAPSGLLALPSAPQAFYATRRPGAASH